LKKCKVCKNPFEPRFNTLQPTCGVPCAIELTKIQAKDAEKAKKRQNKKDLKEFKENDLSWWLQVGGDECHRFGGNTGYWLHRWIRLVRDADKPCPMCGSDTPKGGQWHACHYRSRGAAKQLRFEPDNIYKGCHTCNTRTQGDTGARFRAGIVPRIGEDRVKELDEDNTIHRWTIEECREIRDKYKSLCKQEGVK
jgi:hypothetical protein